MYDFTQADAAEWLGISASHWSLMEDGKRLASPEVAAKLAKVTGVPIEVFIGVEVTR